MKVLLNFRPSFSTIYKRLYAQNHASKTGVQDCDLSKIRNIGIFAHIDAGKTTTTERMLYYSGKISRMGEVHHGNTVTDFLEEERNRGITIKSAVVSFPWNKHIINLADTPGHIDFTMEVEQSLSVIDSGIIILDATSGVEAQTVTVWKQTSKRKLPRLIYVNKFDRADASLSLCLHTLKDKLSLSPLPIHLPLRSSRGFEGVIDLVDFNEILWRKGEDNYAVKPLIESHPLFKEALEERIQLIDMLSSWDDVLAEIIMTRESLEAVTSEELRDAIKRVTLSQKGVPVLCGSSYKNIGVQILMDAMINYLPSPLETYEHEIYKHFNDQLAARSFKIVHDKQKGPITFLRIYSGQLLKGQKVYNTNKEKSEQIGKLMLPFGDDLEEMQFVKSGSMVAVTGLKETIPGNLICNNTVGFKKAKHNIMSTMKLSDCQVDSLLQVKTCAPEPVFFCSVEPPSQAYQLNLDKALAEIQREDPSLQITYNSHTGQTVLAGMGELHLEIIKERLEREYKIDVYFGKLQIVYKEQILTDSEEKMHYKQDIGSQGQNVLIHLSLRHGERADQVVLDNKGDSGANLSRLSPRCISVIKHGISSALAHGPVLSSPVVDVHVVLHWVEVSKGTSETIVAAAASQCVNKALQKSGTRLLEPIMSIDIVTNAEHLNILLAELSKRRSQIISVEPIEKTKELKCETPLAELLGFAKDLRTLTSGTATFTMSFLCYRQMSPQDENDVIERNV